MQRLLTLSLILCLAFTAEAQQTKILKSNGTVINPATEETLTTTNGSLITINNSLTTINSTLSDTLAIQGTATVTGTVTANQGGSWNVSVTSLPSITGSSTPADAKANPTTDIGVESHLMGFNGTTWGRLRSVNTGQLIATILDSSGNAFVTRSLNIDSHLPTVWGFGTASHNYGFNGTTWDRLRSSTTNLGALLTEKRDVLLTANTATFNAVGVTSATALNQNTSRKGLILTNVSTGWVSLSFGGTAVLYSGVSLAPNGGTFKMDAYSMSTATISAIASAASSTLAIQEFQ